MVDLRLTQLEVKVLDQLINTYGPLLYDHRSNTILVQSDEVFDSKEYVEDGVTFKIKMKKKLKV